MRGQLLVNHLGRRSFDEPNSYASNILGFFFSREPGRQLSIAMENYSSQTSINIPLPACKVI